MINEATPELDSDEDSWGWGAKSGGGGGGGFLCNRAALLSEPAVAVGDGGPLFIGVGSRSGLLPIDGVGELPLELRGGGGGGGLLPPTALTLRSEEEAAGLRERGLLGGRSVEIDTDLGLWPPESGLRRSKLPDNLLRDVIEEDSTASFSNLDRKLLTAGVGGVSSTSGGVWENILETWTTGDPEITLLFAVESKNYAIGRRRK